MELGEFLSSLQFTVLFSVLYVFVRISNMVLDIFPVSQPGFCDVHPLPLEVHAAVGFQNAHITHFRLSLLRSGEVEPAAPATRR